VCTRTHAHTHTHTHTQVRCGPLLQHRCSIGNDVHLSHSTTEHQDNLTPYRANITQQWAASFAYSIT
jgi:hypothetical protein